MSILDLLKEKTANEKQNFLNSIRIIKKYYKTNFRV